MRPRLLDLYCGAGGASMGYARAGYEVVGVDLAPQPRYPFEFIQGDALTVGADLLASPGFAAAHGSPPCRDHSSLARMRGVAGTGWLLDATRQLFTRAGLPYIIENVEGAAMPGALVLCGTEFGLHAAGRWLRRHRQFESNQYLMGAGGCNCAGRPTATVAGHLPARTREFKGWQFGLADAREAMGVGWMTGRELAQAIPPAYTQFLGEQLLAALGERAA